MKIRKVVIPAAGLGTRFLPATKAQPKEMLPIVDKPTIQYIMEEVVACGIKSVIIITGRSKRAIEDHFDRSVELEYQLEQKHNQQLLEEVRRISDMVEVYYVRQKQPLGLGHAILCARDFIGNEPFGVLLGDDIVVPRDKPALGQLMEVYEQTGASVVGVQKVPHDRVSKYGIIDPVEQQGNILTLRSMVEKPPVEEAPSDMAILGRYILTPAIFDILEKTPKGSGGEIQLTDGLRALMDLEKVVACEFTGKRYDVGDKLEFLKATVEFALARPDLSPAFTQYIKDLARTL